MKVTDNNITPLQWELILDAFNTHCKEHGAKEDEPLIRDETTTSASGLLSEVNPSSITMIVTLLLDYISK